MAVLHPDESIKIVKSNAFLGESRKLDLLRTLAVLFVVFSHLSVSSLVFQGGNYHIQALGYLGVGIFFVHTCFVLMRSLERYSLQNGNESRALVFFVRRFFRIYPLSIVTVLVLALIAYWFSGVQPDYWAIVSNILLVQNVTGHSSNPAALWSLPFEVQMYLFLPALYVLAERAGGAAPRSLIIILLGSIGFVFFLWFIGLNYHLVKYVPCFLPGILAFTLRKTTLRIPSWSLFGYVVVVAIGFPWLVALGFRESLLLWPVCFVLGLLIPVSSEITSEFLQKLGKLVAKYSYGVYLVHGPCIGLAFGYLKGWAPIMQWLIFVLGTCGFSYIAYHMVEKPGINFGARLAGTVSKQKIFNPGLRATSND